MPKKKRRAPTGSLTLKRLRDMCYMAQTVEQTIPHCFIKRDLFGIIDIIAIKPGEILGVQCTTASNMSSRIKKAVRSEGLREWVLAGGKFQVWGWAQNKQSRRWGYKGWDASVLSADPARTPASP